MDRNHCGSTCGLMAKRCEDSCKVFKHLRLHSLCKTRKKCTMSNDSFCNLNVRVLSVAFTLRNASTSVAGFGISALGWFSSWRRACYENGSESASGKGCMNITGIHRASSNTDHFQLIGANKQELVLRNK